MVVLSGGPYNNLTAAGTTTQPAVTGTLAAQTCHTFTIYDSYGDGINAGYGTGSFMVTDANGTVLAMGGQFTDEDGDAFKTGDAIVQNINDVSNSISIYPNPAKDVLIWNRSKNSCNINWW